MWKGKMPNQIQLPDQIKSSGFSLDSVFKSDLTIAFLSLRIALKAWFSTYQCFRWKYDIIDPNSPPLILPIQNINPIQIQQSRYPIEYYETYSETIIHFHHYFELIIKDILRREHELLVSDASRDPLLLYKLVKGEVITSDESEKSQSIEFSTALSRILKLVENNKLDRKKYDFIINGKSTLESINALRNRLLHRGTYVLPYQTLDEFIGRYVLPLVICTTDLHEYSRKNHDKWCYRQLFCGLDPLTLIVSKFKDQDVNYACIALLKEIGRAAYISQIDNKIGGIRIENGSRERAEALAKIEFDSNEYYKYDVLICPVCGCKSLVRFCDIERENPDFEEDSKEWLVTTNIYCYSCTFEIAGDILKTSQCDIPIDNYWFHDEIEIL